MIHWALGTGLLMFGCGYGLLCVDGFEMLSCLIANLRVSEFQIRL